MSKRVAAAFSIVMVLAILAPLNPAWRGDEGDSFPFSWYPMFSRKRPDPERSMYVVGEEADGTRHIIRSKHYARGTMNQARQQLQRQAARPESAEKLCDQIAKRMAKKTEGDLSRIVRVRIVRGFFDMRKYFGERHKEPLREQTFAVCSVAREPGAAATGDPPDAVDAPSEAAAEEAAP